jgi:hypothetical protein
VPDWRNYANVAIAGVTGAASIALSVLALRGLSPGVAADSTERFRLSLAAGFDTAAEHALLSRDPSDLGRAATLSARALALSPYDVAAWLRLAEIDVRAHGRLTAPGLDALARSYAVAPYNQYVAFWRIRFALDHWGELSPSLRTAVQREVFAVASEPGHRYNLRKTLFAVHNPSGLLMAVIWADEVARFQGGG